MAIWRAFAKSQSKAGRLATDYPITLPPLEEQKRIVAKVGELMKLCNQLEAHLIKKEELGNRLAQAVVAAA